MPAGSMGCVHSTNPGGVKTHGPDTDTRGAPCQADPEVHPEILQLTEVSHCLLLMELSGEGRDVPFA